LLVLGLAVIGVSAIHDVHSAGLRHEMFIHSAEEQTLLMKDLTGVCRQCEQFVAGYYAWRFREPLSTWGFEWPQDKDSYSHERAEREKKQWPMAREFVCGYWSRRSEPSIQLHQQHEGHVFQNSTLRQLVDSAVTTSIDHPSPRMAKRRQLCDLFFDRFVNAGNADQVRDRFNTLKFGCVQGMADACPRKFTGICSPRIACNCLTNNACGDLLGPHSHCLAPCQNQACTNCEVELDKGVTSGTFAKCPVEAFCEVSQSMVGINYHPGKVQ